MATRTTGHFDGFDFDGFWDDHEYSRANYGEPAPSDEQIAEVEVELGYRLPDSFVEFARLPDSRNGGGANRSCFVLDHDDPDLIEIATISGIHAIGRSARYSLLGEIGGPFMMDEWGYPPIGVYFADTPSAGHEMIALDYRECGPAGEPTVVHVDQEGDYRITPLAPDFATFVRGLITEDEAYEGEGEARLADDLLAVARGTLSPIVARALDAVAADLPDGEQILRTIAEHIVREKGAFVLHADGRSWQMYDAIFWLYSQLTTAASFDDYYDMADGQSTYDRPCHVLMLRSSFVADPYGFCTGGHAKGFVGEWWDAKVTAGAIVEADGGWRFTPDYEDAFLRVLRATRTS